MLSKSTIFMSLNPISKLNYSFRVKPFKFTVYQNNQKMKIKKITKCYLALLFKLKF